MKDLHEHEQRTVTLDKEIWDEIDGRAEATGTSSDAVIREALHTYFDLVGPVLGSASDGDTTAV
jgi:hypothetical protein